MSVKKKVFEYLQKIYTLIPKILPGYIGKRFCAESAERLVIIDEIKTKYGIIKYYCFGYIPLWRSQTLFTKEPETIEWIDSMDKNDTLWDIGANVGLYSVYAGLKGMKVFAFEPSALNTFLISKNIEINNLKDNVMMFPIAVSDKNEFGYLNMTSTELGGALSEFNETDIKTVQSGIYKKNTIFKQGMFAYSIDELVEKYHFRIPNYIKIDVDSLEDKILYGAGKTLLNENVKGILLELDEAEDKTQDMIAFLLNKGFNLKEKRRSEEYEMIEHNKMYNYIFWREI